MGSTEQEESIETYYDTIDRETFDRIREVIADDVTYVTAHGK